MWSVCSRFSDASQASLRAAQALCWTGSSDVTRCQRRAERLLNAAPAGKQRLMEGRFSTVQPRGLSKHSINLAWTLHTAFAQPASPHYGSPGMVGSLHPQCRRLSGNTPPDVLRRAVDRQLAVLHEDAELGRDRELIALPLDGIACAAGPPHNFSSHNQGCARQSRSNDTRCGWSSNVALHPCGVGC